MKYQRVNNDNVLRLVEHAHRRLHKELAELKRVHGSGGGRRASEAQIRGCPGARLGGGSSKVRLAGREQSGSAPGTGAG